MLKLYKISHSNNLLIQIIRTMEIATHTIFTSFAPIFTHVLMFLFFVIWNTKRTSISNAIYYSMHSADIISKLGGVKSYHLFIKEEEGPTYNSPLPIYMHNSWALLSHILQPCHLYWQCLYHSKWQTL